MAGQTPTALTNLPVLTNEDGEVKRHRIRTVSELCSSYQTLWWADRASAAMRTMNQQMRDGAPPYDPGRERLLGLAGRANINWGEVEQRCMTAEQPFNSLIDGIDYLCTLPTNYGDPSARPTWEDVMQEEFTRAVMSWDQFVPLWQINSRNFVDEGASFAFFEDDLNWQWDVKGLQHFVFPRRTRASVEFLDMVMAEVELYPSTLYSHCQNKEAAIAEGWNPDACWDAIKEAAQQHGLPSNDYQEWEKAWKDNDLFWGVTAVTVEAIHGWVKEVDGSVSHYIARKDGKGEFLYKSLGKYKAMSRMMVAYIMGVGTNNNFHSIRGLLNRITPAAAGRNKVFCRMLDRAFHDSTPFITVAEEDTLTELPLMPMGQYAVLKPGAAFVEQKFGDFTGNLIPIMGMLGQFMDISSGSYAAGLPQDNSAQPKTKYEKQMQFAQAGYSSTAAMDLFKSCFRRHMQEVVRRFIRKGYSSMEPGGWFVTDFKARCMARGVPEEAIYEIDIPSIDVNMGIGKGSAIERKNVADFIYQVVSPNLDAEGRNRATNMVVAAHTDSRTARILAPIIPGLRPPQDEENAQLENGLLVLGQPVEVKINQMHEIHLEIHIGRMNQIMEALNPALNSMQMPEPGSNSEMMATQVLEQNIPQLSALFQHSEIHFELLSPGSPKRGQFKELLNQFNQAITNGSKQLASAQLKAMREAQHNAGKVGNQQVEGQPESFGGAEQEGTIPNASTFAQQVEASQSLRLAEQAFQHKQETHQMQMALQQSKLQEQQQKMAETQQSMAIRDATAAAKIRGA